LALTFVDLIVGVVLLAFLLDGLRRGFLAALVDLIALLLSLTLGLAFYHAAAEALTTRFPLPHGIARAAGFFLIWLVALGVLSLLGSLIIRLVPGFVQRSLPSRLLGMAPALLHGLLITALALTLLVSLPVAEPFKEAVLGSRIGGDLVARSAVLEGYVDEVFGGAINDSLNLLTVKPDSDERVPLNFTVEDGRIDEVAEGRMLELVNEERARAGLGLLRGDDTLRDVARAHSRDMFRRGYFAHVDPDGRSPFDRMRAGNVTFRAAGENLALAPTVEIAHQGLMTSPGHRANILSRDFGRLGIGVIDGGRHGKMFTQAFAD
jgi:uncharacterized protein YkwD/uncharacterized membrane protein required for colicin V production